MSKVQELLKLYSKLNSDEQAQFKSQLADTDVPDPPGEEISPEEWTRVWHAEIKRRSDRYHRGETTTQDAFEALKQSEQRLRKRRAQ